MSKEEKTTATLCPNCQQPAIRQGNEITCETCDATYTITKKDGAKVKQLGRIELLEQDVATIKAKIFEQEPEPAENPDDVENGSQEDDSVEDGSQEENQTEVGERGDW